LEVASPVDAEELSELLDVAEFFVLPAHRGRGVGRQAGCGRIRADSRRGSRGADWVDAAFILVPRTAL
jgi:GNAT superfamily N-acetyltransferase